MDAPVVAQDKLADWRQLLVVYAGDAADSDRTPMAGSYGVDNGALVFQPRFPAEPGVTYTAVLRRPDHPDQTAVFTAPTRAETPHTEVTRIYPTADVVPENLLKFYVQFSGPMRRGHIYDYIHLLDASGKAVELPFLEVDEELWDPAMTRLTLFIDPGRIKRGVRPLEEIGPALEEGKRFTLLIDAAWCDAQGKALKGPYRKTFAVGPPDREPPDPERWEVRPPKAESREPLVVVFPEPMDHALARRLIRVTTSTEKAVAGEVVIREQERRWEFTPAAAWVRGDYAVVAQPTLEDLAGNNIGKPFEVDLETKPDSDAARAVSVPVKIR